MSRIDESRPFIPVRIAVLTVSDTRTHKTDKSGTLLASMIEEAGHEDVIRKLLGDLTGAGCEVDEAEIRAKLEDCTVEARRQFMAGS